ncbi:hypothetical protein T12_16886, partial [Trichinella patagoniensis]
LTKPCSSCFSSCLPVMTRRLSVVFTVSSSGLKCFTSSETSNLLSLFTTSDAFPHIDSSFIGTFIWLGKPRYMSSKLRIMRLRSSKKRAGRDDGQNGSSTHGLYHAVKAISTKCSAHQPNSLN